MKTINKDPGISIDMTQGIKKALAQVSRPWLYKNLNISTWRYVFYWEGMQ
jgi:hypothetical protein